MASDLIYCDDYKLYEECQKELGKVWPDAVFKDASDEIHRWRFSIDIDSIGDEEFYVILLSLGYLNISLCLCLMKHTDKKRLREYVQKAVIAQGTEQKGDQ